MDKFQKYNGFDWSKSEKFEWGDIFIKLIKSRMLILIKFKILVTFENKRHKHGRNTWVASNIGNEYSKFEFM